MTRDKMKHKRSMRAWFVHRSRRLSPRWFGELRWKRKQQGRGGRNLDTPKPSTQNPVLRRHEGIRARVDKRPLTLPLGPQSGQLTWRGEPEGNRRRVRL